MENHKIDQLFAEKLRRTEVTPSADSWGQVQSQIKPSNKGVWMKVAAALIPVAVVAYFLIPSDTTESAQIASTENGIEQVIEENMESVELPVKQEQDEKQTIIPVQASKPVVMEMVASAVVQEEPEFNAEMPPAVDRRIASIVANDVVGLSDFHPIPENPFNVQIVYIASNSTVDSRTGFEKLWDRAKGLKPGDMWASIRDTKNDFLSGSKN